MNVTVEDLDLKIRKKPDDDSGIDRLGIRWTGSVMTGLLSVPIAQKLEEREARKPLKWTAVNT